MESSDDQNHSNQCSESRCIAGDDEKKIVKVVVNVRAVLFVCTKFPTYQQLFYTKNYRGYICVNCAKVSDEFQKLFNKQEGRFFEKCQREVEACEIIKVQRENKEKLINGIKKLRSQKEKEDVTKIIEEKFDQLEKQLTSNLCNQENNTNVPNSFAAAIKVEDVLPRLKTEKLNGIWCQWKQRSY